MPSYRYSFDITLKSGETPDFSPKGDYFATLNRRDLDSKFGVTQFSFTSKTLDKPCDRYNVLDGALFSSQRDGTGFRQSRRNTVFAVLNIADRGTEVLLPKNSCCLAIGLRPEKHLDGWTIPKGCTFTPTGQHFTFNIKYRGNGPYQCRIPKDELSRHGITFRTMHL